MPDLVNFYESNARAAKNQYYFEQFGCPLKIKIDEEHKGVAELPWGEPGPSSLYVESYPVYDEIMALSELKELLQPGIENGDNNLVKQKFIYLCFYLDFNGYKIDKFPNYLERPKSASHISYNLIRAEISKQTGETSIAWQDRRNFISDLKLIGSKTRFLSKDLEEFLSNVSINDSAFLAKNTDEQLQDLCNGVELLLKDGKQFKSLDYNKYCFGFVTDDIITYFRKKTQAFRHTSKDSFEERKRFSEHQKVFLVDYGIMLLQTILSIKDWDNIS